MTQIRGLSDFEGKWQISRHIQDFAADQHLQAQGLAVFTLGDACVQYQESLSLTLPGGSVSHATRQYRWQEEGADIVVFFDDGRPFHAFDPNAALQQCHHACDPDDYAGTYDFSGWPVWQVTWRVRGPRKDYRLISRYEKQ